MFLSKKGSVRLFSGEVKPDGTFRGVAIQLCKTIDRGL